MPLLTELTELHEDLQACADRSPISTLAECFGPLIPQVKAKAEAEAKAKAKGVKAKTDTRARVTVSSPRALPVRQGVFTYFGAGRQVSTLHFDPNENLLVCISGTKRLWLYPPSDARHLYPLASADGSRAGTPPFQSFADLPAHLHATFADMERTRGPIEVRLQAGDILYLPCGWWHCVEGGSERNMILVYWFPAHPRKSGLPAGAR